ncbi:hypothetical protein SRHO_G00252870 [Serrasalmus rhombeus]
MSPNPVDIHSNYPHKQQDSYNSGVFDRGGHRSCRRAKLSRWSEHGVTAGLFKLSFIRCVSCQAGACSLDPNSPGYPWTSGFEKYF